MRALLNRILLHLLLPALLYAAVALVQLSWNPLAWGLTARGSFAAIALLCMVFTIDLDLLFSHNNLPEE